MNLEDPDSTSPFDVFLELERRVHERGARLAGVEVMGMIPNGRGLPASADRLRLRAPVSSRLLTIRLAAHLARREEACKALVRAVLDAGEKVPEHIRKAASRVADPTSDQH